MNISKYQRGRAYHREVRNKTIIRKKNICKKLFSYDWYPTDGYYAKGKIHCSCKMCAFVGPTHSDMIRETNMNIKEKEYFNFENKEIIRIE